MVWGGATEGWGLLGGILAVIEFGPLNFWTNSYSGAGLTAAAGCLVVGALPRVRTGFRTRDALLLGAGVGLHLLLRPYETIFLSAVALLCLGPLVRKGIAKPLGVAALAMIPAVLFLVVQNKQ